jgi:hypothetical protein
MASSFLEQPEERLHILQRLCRMIGGQNKENGVDVSVQFTVGKLASASLLEIFKVKKVQRKRKDRFSGRLLE